MPMQRSKALLLDDWTEKAKEMDQARARFRARLGAGLLPDLKYPEFFYKGYKLEEGCHLPLEGRIVLLGMPGDCRIDTARLFKRGRIDDIVLGYGRTTPLEDYPEGLWYLHVFGLRRGRIVEPTYKCRKAVGYFGLILSREESDKYADDVLDQKPLD